MVSINIKEEGKKEKGRRENKDEKSGRNDTSKEGRNEKRRTGGKAGKGKEYSY